MIPPYFLLDIFISRLIKKVGRRSPPPTEQLVQQQLTMMKVKLRKTNENEQMNSKF